MSRMCNPDQRDHPLSQVSFNVKLSSLGNMVELRVIDLSSLVVMNYYNHTV